MVSANRFSVEPNFFGPDKIDTNPIKKRVWIRIFGLMSWDARTRQNSRRTRVRRGDARATPLPARRCRVQNFFFRLAPTRLRLGPIPVESGRIGRNFRIGPYREKPPNRSVSGETAETGAEPADLGRNSKKKKGRFEVCG